MSLQQFLELADRRVGLTQWSRLTVPESGSSDLEGPVTKACVSARDHTGGNIRWKKPTAAVIWDKLAVIRQVARRWTIQRLVYEQSQLKLNTSPHRQTSDADAGLMWYGLTCGIHPPGELPHSGRTKVVAIGHIISDGNVALNKEVAMLPFPLVAGMSLADTLVVILLKWSLPIRHKPVVEWTWRKHGTRIDAWYSPVHDAEFLLHRRQKTIVIIKFCHLWIEKRLEGTDRNILLSTPRLEDTRTLK